MALPPPYSSIRGGSTLKVLPYKIYSSQRPRGQAILPPSAPVWGRPPRPFNHAGKNLLRKR